MVKPMRVNPVALRAMRELAGFGVAEFAGKVGITPAHLSNIEADRRKASPHVIKAMADALHVPLPALTFPLEEAS